VTALAFRGRQDEADIPVPFGHVGARPVENDGIAQVRVGIQPTEKYLEGIALRRIVLPDPLELPRHGRAHTHAKIRIAAANDPQDVECAVETLVVIAVDADETERLLRTRVLVAPKLVGQAILRQHADPLAVPAEFTHADV